MPNIIVVNREGEKQSVEMISGSNLMQSLRDEGYEELVSMCGGNCACATCHVYVDRITPGMVKPSVDESDLLAMSLHRTDNSRLACQVVVSDAMDGMEVTLAPED